MPFWILLIAAFALFVIASLVDDSPPGGLGFSVPLFRTWREGLAMLIFLIGMACMFASMVLGVIQSS